MNNNNRIIIPLGGGLLVVLGLLLDVTTKGAAHEAKLEALEQQIILLREDLDEKTVSRYKETDAIRNHDLIMERIRALEQRD